MLRIQEGMWGGSENGWGWTGMLGMAVKKEFGVALSGDAQADQISGDGCPQRTYSGVIRIRAGSKRK
jgi:hypothetical protein